MKRFLASFGALFAASLVIGSASVSADEPRPGDAEHVDYNRDIRPILSRSCFPCHGADESTREADLRLDIRDEAIEMGAIEPDDPDSSYLMDMVLEEDDSLRMPPRKTGPRLTEDEINLLRNWIAQGAKYAEHWAFIAPKAVEPPAVADESWPRGGIDRFILARLEAEGMRPSPEADRPTLLRRLSLDLRGLPPSPEELRSFLDDTSPDAYERVVDRFLDDPAFGERWARVWLDLARYADSAGYGSDPLRTIWGYRDWVIAAINANMPYDRFTIEQIAGDLLPDPTLDQKIATAFNRNTMTNTEGGTDDEEFRVAAIKDRVDTTMQVWMGLTMGCAKCHTHKYDPISQEEYYQCFAIFNQTADNDQPNESPVLPLPGTEAAARNQEIDAQIAALKAKLGDKPADQAETPESKAIGEEIAALEKSRPEIPTVPIMVELPPDQRRVTHILNKGNFLDPGDEVSAGLPQAFHPMPGGGPVDRMALAKWLVDPHNPLTARVAVNRFWARLFGAGIVETEEDFGTQGEAPSHPKLLDWLAVDFMEKGWDVKGAIKQIVLSATYRQSSRTTAEHLDKDPKNRLLARAPRVRLDAETIRDQALALSGLLSRKVGGPSVFPPQPDGLWQAAFNGQRTWATSEGADKYRRALYTFWRRTVPYPSMAAFDAPSRELCTVKRVRTNTPLQALVTLNDPVYIEAAQALARRIVREGGESIEDRARFGLELCLGRPAESEQVARLVELFQDRRDRYAQDIDAARALATDPLGPLPEGAEPAEMAAWTTVSNVLLNLDAVLTRG